ncbi:hypothetical protein QUF49_10910 [Fictibacillus sp. b24]|uniref:hypothetical protein n=1 Tax=Fictibacillus sp. b24 TaxID=3055863 RepID=UPI0025A1E970|nr:hypothetical protein [Fictibacillus sp. b24]MDM5316503.1 hypothetical protein [Fictibacillus sp. b24]
MKLIELQVAIPRTVDAAKSATETLNRGLLQQEHKSETIRKKEKMESKRVNKRASAEESILHTKSQQEKNTTSTSHPFKGQKIDYSG